MFVHTSPISPRISTDFPPPNDVRRTGLGPSRQPKTKKGLGRASRLRNGVEVTLLLQHFPFRLAKIIIRASFFTTHQQLREPRTKRRPLKEPLTSRLGDGQAKVPVPSPQSRCPFLTDPSMRWTTTWRRTVWGIIMGVFMYYFRIIIAWQCFTNKRIY